MKSSLQYQSPAATAAVVCDLDYILRMLHWTGSMRHPNAGVWASRFFYLRYAVVEVTILLFLCSEGAVLWMEGAADLDRFTMALCTFNTVLMWGVRLASTAFHEWDFHHLASQVGRDFGSYISHQDLPLLWAKARTLRRFSLIYIFTNMFIVTLWVFLPLIQFGICEQGLAFIVALPFDATQPLAFLFSWLHSTFIAYHVAIMTIVLDSFNANLMEQLRIQLMLLSRNLMCMAANDYKTDVPATQLNSHVNATLLGSRSQNDIECRLGQCINHHQAIIRNHAHLEKCLSRVLFVQSLSIGMVVCIQLFQMTMTADNLAEAGRFFMYLGTMASEIFVYCWFGNDLITESEDVSWAAYTLAGSLEGCPTSTKRSLITVMIRAQRPLRITAGGFFPLSRESFVSVVNMSYSFSTILRNFKDE